MSNDRQREHHELLSPFSTRDIPSRRLAATITIRLLVSVSVSRSVLFSCGQIFLFHITNGLRSGTEGPCRISMMKLVISSIGWFVGAIFARCARISGSAESTSG